jgi:hypothetical protein
MIPPLTDRMEAELADFAEAGIILTPAEILFLYEACSRVDNPFSALDARLVEVPVKVGNEYLWTLSVGASVWLDTFAKKWWGGSDELYFWALVYALLNARDAAAFKTDEHDAYNLVKCVGMKFACSRQELESAVDLLLGAGKDVQGQKEKRRESAAVSWNAVISELEVYSGIMRHEWLWGRSVLVTADSYAALYTIASSLSGNGGQNMHDELDRAISNLARTKKAIRKNHHG